MKVKLLKDKKISEAGNKLLPKGTEINISDSAAEVFIKHMVAEKIKEDYKGNQTAQETIELIKGAKSIEDLKPYESDPRTTVLNALDAKKKELGNED